MENIEVRNRWTNTKELKSGYDFIYNDLPLDMGYKFKYDNIDFLNRQKINID